MLSTPKHTSPWGASLDRISLLTSSPPSPPSTISSLKPLVFSNSFLRLSETWKELWVTTVTFLASALVSCPHAASVAAPARARAPPITPRRVRT